MEAIQVFKDDFDNSENNNPEHTELLGTFIADGKLSAQGKANSFIENMEPVKLYLGWNRKVYPRIRVEKIYIK